MTMKASRTLWTRSVVTLLVSLACLSVSHGDAPIIDRFERVPGAVRFHFVCPQLQLCTVEYTDSLPATNTNWRWLSFYRDGVDVWVRNSFANAQTRFFRVRQEPCGCR